jgi:hypothetical protein
MRNLAQIITWNTELLNTDRQIPGVIDVSKLPKYQNYSCKQSLFMVFEV